MAQPSAQRQKVQGKVVDAETNAPVIGAVVKAVAVSDSAVLAGAITQPDGTYDVEVPTGIRLYLEVQYVSYLTLQSDTFKAKAGQPFEVPVLTLQPNATEVEGLEVTARYRQVYREADKQVYRADQFQDAVGGTADDAIKNLPGVSLDANGQLRLRGSENILLYINGSPITGDPATVISQLAADNIKSIELITNPGASYDAEGAGGIINIVTESLASTGYSASVGLQAGLPSTTTFGNIETPRRYGASATGAYRAPRWDVALAGNFYRKDLAGFRELDAWTQVNDPVRTYLPSTGERSFRRQEASFQSAFSWRPATAHTLNLAATASFKRQKRRADLLFENRRENLETGDVFGEYTFFNNNFEWRNGDFYLFNADYNWAIDSARTLSLSALYEYSFFNGPTENREFPTPAKEELINFVDNTNDSPLDGFRVRADYSHQLGGIAWTTGIQYRRITSSIDFKYLELDRQTNTMVENDEFSNFIIFSRDVWAGYVQSSFALADLSVTVGLRGEQAYRRLEHDTTDGPLRFDQFNVFPNLRLAYPLGNNGEWFASYSKRIERNTIYQLNPFPEREHSYVLERGDDNLRPELSDQVELGVSLETKQSALTTSLFYQKTDNVINRFNTVFNDTIVNRFYSNVGTSDRLGVDVAWQWTPVDWMTARLNAVVFNYWLKGEYEVEGNIFRVNNSALQYTANPSLTLRAPYDTDVQIGVNILSERVTAQGEDSRFYTPFLSVRKSFLQDRMSIQAIWKYIDLGVLNSHEQRITNRGEDFFTSVSYIYETDVVLVNLTYNINKFISPNSFKESEMLEREF